MKEKSSHYNEIYDYGEVPEDKRVVKPRELFPIWFASNLTIGDFAVGFIPVIMGLNIYYTIITLFAGTFFGSILLGIISITGPRTGLPQMSAGKRAFGKKFGNFLSSLQWLNTIGWTTVNLVLAAFAFTLLFHVYSVISILILTAAIFLLSYAGHHVIAVFEKIMGIVLAFLFIFIILISFSKYSMISSYDPLNINYSVAIGITLAASFSDIISWTPYAGDYSRYTQDKKSVVPYVFFGSFSAAFVSEIAGMLVAILSLNPNGNPAIDMQIVLGKYSVFGLFALFLGGIAADAINLYSNSLSLKVIGFKFKRSTVVIIGSIITFLTAIITYSKFYLFYEDFLFILDYWITPWIGIIIADFFIINKNKKFSIINDYNKTGITSYLIALMVSAPFMNPGFLYSGIISSMYLGGVDISYYISFIIAMLLYIGLRGHNNALSQTA
ncbi:MULTISPECIES: cytosine permease [Acidiplasma]|uniref:Allantoin permease n=3 Tax=Acidiplasma TaxID=507753 RepID=A0A0Q0VUF2_9ARCH|nr:MULTISPECIES: cytosine permease [Acidiplasma]KJE49571.1 allantoin permease [Acidiplasma sp. MBA-1]KQB35251.1 allantoin permease [Acidiplasma cupricumulans]KQB36405.1 allantoin permease [Acidiplasma aeolicum]WMT55883.1 MAG: cytosine permease [Acidiplasma sp.]